MKLVGRRFDWETVAAFLLALVIGITLAGYSESPKVRPAASEPVAIHSNVLYDAGKQDIIIQNRTFYEVKSQSLSIVSSKEAQR